MGKFERFIKTAGIYFLGNVFTKLLSFFLLPLYTNRINPNDFGEFGLIVSLSNLIIPLVFFQVWDSVFRFSFDYTEKKDKFEVIANGLLVMLFGLLTYSLSYIILANLLEFNYTFLVFGYALFIGIQYFYSVVARAMQNNKLFVISGTVNSFVMIILNIVLIVVFDRGIDALYISSIAGVLAQILIIETDIKLYKNLDLSKVSKDKIIELIRFSLPLSISTVTHWLLTGYTQVSISMNLGTYANGLFTVSNKFSSMLILLVGVFQFAWNEMAYIISNDDNKTTYYNKSVTEILKISIIGTSVFIILIKIIFPYFIGEQYKGALYIIPIIMIGTMANTYSGFLGTIFLANKNSDKLFKATLLSSIINVISLNIFIPIWGLNGAVLSLALSFIVGTISRTILLHRSAGVSPEKDAYLSLIMLLVSVVTYYLINNTVILIVVLFFQALLSLVWLRKLFMLLLGMFKVKMKL